jgi:hypothetical protein
MRFPRLLTVSLLALALLAAQAGEGVCAAKKKRRAATPPQTQSQPQAKAQEQVIPAGDLQHPYAPGDNATAWFFDTAPVPKPAAARTDADALPFSFELKPQERIIDPLTQKELTPRSDPLKAKESLKNLDFKDAMDKIGGKAEVKVDILKF